MIQRPRLALVELEEPDDFAISPEQHASLQETTARWPQTRLAGWSLMALLWVCQITPEFVGVGSDVRWFALLLPAVLVTIATRLLFEVFAFGEGRAARAISIFLTAVIATCLMLAAEKLTGLRWEPAGACAMFGSSALALCIAQAARNLEVRMHRALRRVYFVGRAETGRDLERELRRRRDASFVGASLATTVNDSRSLIPRVLNSRATVLVLDLEAARNAEVIEAASSLNYSGLYIRDLGGYYETQFKKIPLSELSPNWFLFDVAAIHRKPFSRAIQRLVEVALAVVALVLISPVLFAAMLAIRLTSPGPAFYRQLRVGKGGTAFTLLKLRTMTVAGDDGGWAGSHEHRITSVGRVLRKFRLDEVPQFWNIICGDLALVGPRPEQVSIVEGFEREIPFYGARHCIRPGLTGWAQVNLGYAGSLEGTLAKLQRDLYYIKHSGLRLDALILWMTFRTIVSGRG